MIRLWMNLHLNKSSESIQLLIHKDSHCLSPNVHTIHPKYDISHVQYYMEQIGWIYTHWDAGTCFVPEWISRSNESIESMIQWSNQ